MSETSPEELNVIPELDQATGSCLLAVAAAAAACVDMREVDVERSKEG